MVQITVKTIHAIHGNHEMVITFPQSQTIRNLLSHMLMAHTEIASVCINGDYLCVSEEYNMIVNGSVFELYGYDYLLQDGDNITFFAAYSGG